MEFYEEHHHRESEDVEELYDPHSSKFRAEGQLMNYEEEPSFEGYLQVKVMRERERERETIESPLPPQILPNTPLSLIN